MSFPSRQCLAIVLAVGLLASAPALAAGKTASSTPMLPGANSKEPISIEADKLNYFDKEQKAIYTGHVVAIQGDSRLTCSVLTIFLAKTETPAAGAPAPAASAAPAPAPAAGSAGVSTGGSQVKHMDAVGPVSVTSKTQVATGDRGSYDKEQNKVWLFDNVTMTDSGNVTKGDKLTYDLTTGEAVVEVGKTSSRVSGVFIQGSGTPDGDAANKPAPPKKEAAASANDKPKAAKKKVPADAAAAKTQ
jgi:lipopolysaccharide export system protein LptA